MRPLLKNLPKNISIEAQQKWAFVDKKTGGYNNNNNYYDIQIHNNLPCFSGTQKKVTCEFCNKQHNNNCLLNFDEAEVDG